MPTLKPNGKRLNGKGSHWISRKRRLALYERDNWTCIYCHEDLENVPARERTLDHVISTKRGGTNEDNNLVTCCLSCNSKKQQSRAQFVVEASSSLGSDCSVTGLSLEAYLTFRRTLVTLCDVLVDNEDDLLYEAHSVWLDTAASLMRLWTLELTRKARKHAACTIDEGPYILEQLQGQQYADEYEKERASNEVLYLNQFDGVKYIRSQATGWIISGVA